MAKKIIYVDDGDSSYVIWLNYGKFKMQRLVNGPKVSTYRNMEGEELIRNLVTAQ